MADLDARPQQFWLQFLATLEADNPRRRAKPDAFGFGGSGAIADELAALTLSGVKKATASLPVEYTSLDEPLPKAGDLSIILDGEGAPVAVIERTSVEQVAFCDVGQAFASEEGEGDGSLSYWREAHRWYFNQVCSKFGETFDERALVLCQRFRLVWPRTPEDMLDAEQIVRTGIWLHDQQVPTRISILKRPITYGSGDYEDPPEISDDRDEPCFVVRFDVPGQPGVPVAGGGQFVSIDAALEDLARLGMEVRWDPAEL